MSYWKTKICPKKTRCPHNVEVSMVFQCAGESITNPIVVNFYGNCNLSYLRLRENDNTIILSFWKCTANHYDEVFF